MKKAKCETCEKAITVAENKEEVGDQTCKAAIIYSYQSFYFCSDKCKDDYAE